GNRWLQGGGGRPGKRILSQARRRSRDRIIQGIVRRWRGRFSQRKARTYDGVFVLWRLQKKGHQHRGQEGRSDKDCNGSQLGRCCRDILVEFVSGGCCEVCSFSPGLAGSSRRFAPTCHGVVRSACERGVAVCICGGCAV